MKLKTVVAAAYAPSSPRRPVRPRSAVVTAPHNGTATCSATAGADTPSRPAQRAPAGAPRARARPRGAARGLADSSVPCAGQRPCAGTGGTRTRELAPQVYGRVWAWRVCVCGGGGGGGGCGVAHRTHRRTQPAVGDALCFDHHYQNECSRFDSTLRARAAAAAAATRARDATARDGAQLGQAAWGCRHRWRRPGGRGSRPRRCRRAPLAGQRKQVRARAPARGVRKWTREDAARAGC